MPIVSISLDSSILKKMDRLEKSLGFSGRSGVMRAAIRHFIAEENGANAASGSVHAVVLIMHSQKAEDTITRMTHRFSDVIATHLHNRFEEDKCMETFVMSGDALRIRRMFKDLQSSRKTDYVKLLLVE
jgi:CopG family nickel-responsive transcriptional regulator